MNYKQPKSEKANASKPPVTANFAPPPVEQPVSATPAEDADEEDDTSEGQAGQAANFQA